MMKRTALITSAICWLALWISAASAQSTVSSSATHNVRNENSPAAITQLAHEVRQLKIEVLRLQIELQRGKLVQVEHELEQVRGSQRRLSEEEGELTGEISKLDQQLNLTTLTTEERAEMSAAREQLAARGPERLFIKRQRIAQGEAEINQQLQREQQRWQELIKQASELKVEVDESSTRPKTPVLREW